MSDYFSFTITDNTEFLTMELKNKQDIITCCICVIPGSDISILTHTFEELIKSKICNLYLCGDFNVNQLNYKNGKYQIFFTDVLLSATFFNIID